MEEQKQPCKSGRLLPHFQQSHIVHKDTQELQEGQDQSLRSWR